MAQFRTAEQFEVALPSLGRSPMDKGLLQFIFQRTATNQRKQVYTAELSRRDGLVGDYWSLDRAADDRGQVSLMNSRVLQLIAGDESRLALAGDNLIVDFDLSELHLPPGTQLAIGTAILELTDLAHTGCRKFESRYGKAAKQFVNSPEGRQMNLRGRYARVVQEGTIAVGDIINRLVSTTV
jgi:MOSC domain-containing protein YiiM